jgi:S-adenosylmethionine decarboxylase
MRSFRPAQDRPPRENAHATTATVLDQGIEWLVDAEGCNPGQLSDLLHLQEICAELVDALRLRVIGEPQWHQFPSLLIDGGQGGVTGLYLLAESHLACHTFPEEGRVSFNLYCCRKRPAWDWKGFLEQRLGATSVVARSIPRGRLKPDREERP